MEIRPNFSCFLRYIINTVGGKDRGFKNLNIDRLKEQFTELKIDYTKGLSVNDVQMWIDIFGKNSISLIALDPHRKVFHRKMAHTPSLHC